MAFTKGGTNLADILLRNGKITQEKYDRAMSINQNEGTPLRDIFIEKNLTSAEDVAMAQGELLNVPYMSLKGIVLPAEIQSLVSGSVLRKHSVCPIAFPEDDINTVILAMANPLDMEAMDDISIITGCMVEPRISTEGEINHLLDKYYGSDEAMSAAEAFQKDREARRVEIEEQKEEDNKNIDSAPIVMLVRSIFDQAVRSRASDIHIDAHETQVVVRYRIDGALTKVMTYDISLMPVIVTRLKIMGGMDIAEKRKPQDGRITITVDRSEYDIRVSMLPTCYGEKVVMRIASTVALTRTKAQLGMKEEELKRFDHIISNPNGIILVTGPTGSGKSTTLYTALSELNDESVNIITVEDPVEANISGLNQVQVNNKAGLTFAAALRSILRQDPDIIMIGEIRDLETASIAVQASITGHLVVSTLHTNSAAATVTRLLDMGLESFLLADSLVGIIAQRLVRKLCVHCKKPREATEDEKNYLGYPVDQPLTIYEPCGCPMCNDTGFYGRTGVYEIMQITPEIKHMITIKAATNEIRDTAVKTGMNTLHMSAAKIVIEGVTTMKELMKVSFDS